MLTRRLIRIKVFKLLFSYNYNRDISFSHIDNELIKSCEATLEQYYFVLNLFVALKNVAEEKIEVGLKKFKPTPQELNPNRRFVENSVIELISKSGVARELSNDQKLSWENHLPFVKKLYATISEKEYFKEYMSFERVTRKRTIELLIEILEEELIDNDELDSILEDINFYWTDDLTFVVDSISDSLRGIKDLRHASLPEPSIFFEEEDRGYALQLLNRAIENYDSYQDLLSQYLLNWKSERVALSDSILIIMGITEALHFPSIPIKVTINEYVELSKYYSTPNSREFVNGLLDKIVTAMVQNGEIQKSGRGLVGWED